MLTLIVGIVCLAVGLYAGYKYGSRAVATVAAVVTDIKAPPKP